MILLIIILLVWDEDVLNVEHVLTFIIIILLVWDEDVLNVEHVLTFMTVLGACVAGARVFIPDENLGTKCL